LGESEVDISSLRAEMGDATTTWVSMNFGARSHRL
jgi:hypothetical protein